VFDDGKWKTWVAVVVFVLVIGFAVRQYQSTFVSHPPAWMHLQEHTSQRIPNMREIESPWRQFAELLRFTRAAAESQHVSDYRILLVELTNNERDSILWSGETIPNQGFEPMPTIERELYMDPSGILGYYNSDGAPLAFATRKNPDGGDLVIATVHTDKPIAPGASMFLIRREHRAGLMGADVGGGQRVFGFGFMRPGPDIVEARGLLLPRHARLVRYLPEAPAIMSPALPAMVAWISTDLKTNTTPLSITFAPQ
jgi:hypothetical protein